MGLRLEQEASGCLSVRLKSRPGGHQKNQGDYPALGTQKRPWEADVVSESKDDIKLSSIIVICILMCSLAVFSYKQNYNEQPRDAPHYEHEKAYDPALLREQFKGQKPNDAAQCYQGETPSDCAGRIVQQKVAGFYVYLTIAAGAQLFVGLLTAYTVYEQTKITGRQLSIAVNAAGPIVFLKGFKCEWLYDVDDRARVHSWRFTPIWENTGQGLARRLINRSNFETFTPDFPEEFDFPDLQPVTEMVPAHMGPGGTLEFGAVEVAVFTLVAAKKKMLKIFIWGWCEYTSALDITVRDRRVEFCNGIDVYGDPRDRDCRFAFPFVGRHNGEGDTCYRKQGENAPVRTGSAASVDIPEADWAEFGIVPRTVTRLPHDALPTTEVSS